MSSFTVYMDKPFVKIFIEKSVKSFVFTLLWIPVYLIRSVLVHFIAKAKPSYGRILDHEDATLEENFTETPPKNNLVFTLIINGSLELQELRALYMNTVLGQKLHDKKTGEDMPRYPELKQYQVDLAGYKFWRNDQTFNVDNHITEDTSGRLAKKSIPKIHEEMTNTTFKKKRSPWEIILVNKYKSTKTLLIHRSHHTLGDTKSVLKILVEGLGQKKLTLPEASYKHDSFLSRLLYYIFLPFYFVYVQVINHYVAIHERDSPFKFTKEKEPPLKIGISKKVTLDDIKAIAKRNNVTTSAVIMAAVAGGIGKNDERLGRRNIMCQWIMPKPNHPAKLINHHYSAVMELPTTTFHSPRDRLQKCNEIFLSLKASDLHIYNKAILFQTGSWFNPLRAKFMKSTTFPLMITNIASDREGFQIGNRDVEELTMTCAPNLGSYGLIICPFSYKNTIEISATVKEGILTETETQKLVDLMGNEFEVLKNA